MRKLPHLIFISIFACFLSDNLYAQRPAIKWQKCLGGSGDDKANDVLLNTDASTVVVGFSKSNDGDVTGHHGSLDYSDAWVAKLDARGNLLWQQSLGGDYNDAFNTVIATNDGGYLCVGYTYINRPGSEQPGIYEADFYLVKLNNEGDVIWEKKYGGSKYDAASSAIQTIDGGFVIIGTAYSDDGNVQSGTEGRMVSNAWVIKTNSNGQLTWEKCLQYGLKDNSGIDIVEEADQDLVAYTKGSTFYQYISSDSIVHQVEESPGIVYTLNKATGAATFKFNTSGDTDFSMCKTANKYYFSFQDNIYHPEWDCVDRFIEITNAPLELSTVTLPPVHTPVCTTFQASTIKYYYAGGHGIAWQRDSSVVLAGHSSYDYRFEALDPAVLYFPGKVTSYSYGATGYNKGQSYFNSVKVFETGDEYMAAGSTYADDGDVSGHHGIPGRYFDGTSDCWILRLVNRSKIEGNVFVDINGNGLKDAGELPFENGFIQFKKTDNPEIAGSLTPRNGTYQIYPDSIGTYFTHLQINKPYYTTSNPGQLSVFTDLYQQTDSVNFPVMPIPGIKDYVVSLGTPGNLSPHLDGQQDFYIYYANRGTDTPVNKPLIFIKDPRSSFMNSNPMVSAISGDTLIWNIDMLPDSSVIINVSLQMEQSPALMIGDSVYFSASVDSVGDINAANNQATISLLVKGSLPSLSKRERHGETISTTDMLNDEYLVYTIRFQNLGNEAATEITINDTLESKLDVNTLEILSSTYPYTFTLSDDKYAAWDFSGISLPPYFTNPEASTGYLTYRIKPLPGFKAGDTIRNTATIRFGYNNPVVSNTQLTIFFDKCVWAGTVSTEWENSLNWSCGKVPDENTDVYINGGTSNNPEINSEAFCRAIYVSPGASVQVNAGHHLHVGKQ